MKKPENLQDYFDNAWEWFVLQKNGISVEFEAGAYLCMYRTSKGTKCAIGASILDEDYQYKIEEKPAVEALEVIGYPVYVVVDGRTTSIKSQLMELQRCHDTMVRLHATPSPEQFLELIEHNLRDFALSYELEIPA